MSAEKTAGDYYARKDAERCEAQERLDDARARGASLEEIRRLDEAVLDAGYTGD